MPTTHPCMPFTGYSDDPRQPDRFLTDHGPVPLAGGRPKSWLWRLLLAVTLGVACCAAIVTTVIAVKVKDLLW